MATEESNQGMSQRAFDDLKEEVGKFAKKVDESLAIVNTTATSRERVLIERLRRDALTTLEILGHRFRAPEPKIATAGPGRGPNVLYGVRRMEGPDGSFSDLGPGPVALCACGKSQNKPFCDGSHKG